jgi:hypothetical protein
MNLLRVVSSQLEHAQDNLLILKIHLNPFASLLTCRKIRRTAHRRAEIAYWALLWRQKPQDGDIKISIYVSVLLIVSNTMGRINPLAHVHSNFH